MPQPVERRHKKYIHHLIIQQYNTFNTKNNYMHGILTWRRILSDFPMPSLRHNFSYTMHANMPYTIPCNRQYKLFLTTKARYTLATKSTVAENGDKLATRPSLLPIYRRYWRHIGDKVKFNSLLRSTLSPTRSTLSPIRSTSSPKCQTPFRLCRQCVRGVYASVYRAKASWSTSTKSTVLNSTLSPVCTRLNGLYAKHVCELLLLPRL